jgi:hypothetical protein
MNRVRLIVALPLLAGVALFGAGCTSYADPAYAYPAYPYSHPYYYDPYPYGPTYGSVYFGYGRHRHFHHRGFGHHHGFGGFHGRR